MTYPILRFSNPVFHKGKEDKAIIERHGIVELSSYVIRAKDLSYADVANEHDPKCRTPHDLIGELRRVYKGFNEKEIVTVVEFEIT